jgi:hypothetical protein
VLELICSEEDLEVAFRIQNGSAVGIGEGDEDVSIRPGKRIENRRRTVLEE